MTIKVLVNGTYGGFSLSDMAIKWLENHGVKTSTYSDLPRHEPLLIQCFEELGNKANGKFSRLYIHELIGNKYRIEEYDGSERVIEPEDQEWIIVNN